MKYMIILLLTAFGSPCLTAQTPNWNEWFKQKKTQRKYLIRQIAALQVHQEYVKTGYRIVNKGLTAIGDIKDGTFNLDKDYFNSLKQVNPLIRKSPKVNEILVYQQVIINEFKKLTSFCRTTPHLTSNEIKYVNAVYKGMLTHGNLAVDELTIITTAGEAEMTDDQRLQRLDSVHLELQEQYTFTKEFVNGVKFIATQRGKAEHEINSMRKLYDINR